MQLNQTLNQTYIINILKPKLIDKIYLDKGQKCKKTNPPRSMI